MTIDELVCKGIDDLMMRAATMAAETSSDPDECAGIPLAFFGAAEALRKAWREYVPGGIVEA